MKKFAVILGGLLVISLGVVLIGPSFIDWNQYKTEIAQPITELSGRDLTIEGDVSFAVLPTPALSAAGVSLANMEGAQSGHMARLGSLEIRVAFLPLLSGQIKVESVKLIEPVIALEVLADGRANWMLGGIDATGGGETDGLGLPGVPDDVRFDHVEVENGILTYNDAITGTAERIDELDATISAKSFHGPFSAKGIGTVRGTEVSLEVLVGDMSAAAAIPISVKVGLPDAGAEASFAGWASEAGKDANFNGRFTASGEDLTAALKGAGSVAGLGKLAAMGDSAGLDQAFFVEAGATANRSAVQFSNASMRLGATSATLEMTARFGEAVDLNGKVDFTSLDLDTFAGGDDDAPANGGSALAGMLPLVALPPDLTGELAAKVSALSYRGGVARQIELALRLGGGAIHIDKAAALLPGGSEFGFAGSLQTSDRNPRLEGHLKLNSSNLRGLLSWLDMGAGVVPVARLTRMELATRLKLTNTVFQVYGMDLGLDTTHLRGGISVGLIGRPAYGIDLTADRINAAAYFDSGSEGPDAGAKGGARQLLSALAALDDFDANLKLKVDELSLPAAPLSGMVVDAALLKGALTVKTLTVREFAGASVQLSGSMVNLAAAPLFDLKLKGRAGNLSRLTGLGDVPLPAAPALRGEAEIDLALLGAMDEAQVNLEIALAKTNLKASGSVSDILGATNFDLAVEATDASFANFARQFDLGITPPADDDDGPISIGGTLSQGPGPLGLNLDVDVSGGRFNLTGQISAPWSKPEGPLRLKIQHPELRQLVRGFGYDWRPAGQQLGSVTADASLVLGQEGYSLESFTGNAGSVELGAQVSRPSGSARSLMNVTLGGGEVDLNRFLRTPTTGIERKESKKKKSKRKKKAKAPPPMERWSRAPLDTMLLGTLDADVRVAAKGIQLRGYDFRNPGFDLRLRDRVVRLENFRGQLFGGGADLAATLDAREVPRLDLTLSLTNADVKQALDVSANLPNGTGRFGFSGRFSAAGASQYEMISSLDGTAQFAARDGTIRGIDIDRLGDRLANLDQLGDFVRLLARTLSGGETPFQAIDGTLVFENGVGRSQDVTVLIDAVDSEMAANLDLPAWTMQSSARFRFKERPDLPAVGVDLSGPISAPRVKRRTKKMENYLAERAAKALVRKLLAPPPTPGEPGAEPGEEPRKIRPEDLLFELLKKKKK